MELAGDEHAGAPEELEIASRHDETLLTTEPQVLVDQPDGMVEGGAGEAVLGR